MLGYGLLIPLFHILFVAPLLFYAGWCLRNCNTKVCVKGFPSFLMGLAFVIVLYHLYNLIVRLGLIEGFVRQGGYLGKPIESFVPFSFPYQKETDRYYSYHDTENKRNCGCKGECTCNGHLTHSCNCNHYSQNTTEPFDTISPAENSIVRSGL